MHGEILSGIKIVTLALNVPGPVATARLVRMGATAIKIEPPAGDPLVHLAPSWYEWLASQLTIVRLDLKDVKSRHELNRFLGDADLLITSFRPSALKRFGLDWESVHLRHPRLCAVNIIGYAPPEEEIPGHDLTYQAKLGLLQPPHMPGTLYVDMAGVERTVSAALALLLNFARTGSAAKADVSLHECICDAAVPFTAGLTTPGGPLDGSFPFYGLYRSSDGWIALAALEPGFSNRLQSELNLTADSRSELEPIFLSRTSAEWEHWARERDLPLVAVLLKS